MKRIENREDEEGKDSPW